MTATKVLPHQARAVKSILEPVLYKKPAIGGAIVREKAPAEAASPLIFPRTESEGLACLMRMRRTG